MSDFEEYKSKENKIKGRGFVVEKSGIQT